MNNPRYRLLKNKYIAPTNNAGAPSPRSENSGTVCVAVAVVDVCFAVTTSIVGCLTVVTAAALTGFTCFVGSTFTTATACFTGVGVAFTTATACFTGVVPIAAFMAVAICVCETSPTNLAG